MTLQEFKAWFEGFTESMHGAPNAKQWARIKQRVGEIDGVITTQKVFVERYWPYYTTCDGATSGTITFTETNAVSSAAMYALGQAERAT